MALFFTSDTHFGHKNILVYDKRPFDTIEQHDEALINNWNSVVTEKDDVWHLGDFCLRSARPASWYLSRLRGRVHLVRGNHDDKAAWRDKHLFSTAQEAAYIKHESQRIYLCHYSCRVWRASHRGSWHLFGHSHGGLDHIGEALGKSMDVGVNLHGYRPLSFQEVKKALDARSLLPHHGEDE
jgi:calcineurin-like phosphoesterase family protein